MSEMVAQKIWVNLQSQISEEKYFSCKLSVHSKYQKVSEFILDCLNEQDMDFMVENTQFGNLIKYAADYNLSSQILWFMVMRQVYATDDDEMWFVLNDRPVRFSRMEYALITELDCSDNFPDEVVEVSDFCDRYFLGSDKVSVKEVEMKLKDLKSVDELSSIERVKMACLYFVCGVLWPIAPVKNPQVYKEIFSLIDDFDVFNKYPWGTIAFKGAVCDLKKKKVVLSKKTENGKSSNSGTHDMVGFINPLHILAYECVRGIGERERFRNKEKETIHLFHACANGFPTTGQKKDLQDILTF
ncbi:uncharacterized protein [Primulina huaijiensis]|uniref:uncharacterized protein n=1 Tax=Primulina huaijiensis TaxID=1492673 RepID=UPI003CC77654